MEEIGRGKKREEREDRDGGNRDGVGRRKGERIGNGRVGEGEEYREGEEEGRRRRG